MHFGVQIQHSRITTHRFSVTLQFSTFCWLTCFRRNTATQPLKGSSEPYACTVKGDIICCSTFLPVNSSIFNHQNVARLSRKPSTVEVKRWRWPSRHKWSTKLTFFSRVSVAQLKSPGYNRYKLRETHTPVPKVYKICRTVQDTRSLISITYQRHTHSCQTYF